MLSKHQQRLEEVAHLPTTYIHRTRILKYLRGVGWATTWLLKLSRCCQRGRIFLFLFFQSSLWGGFFKLSLPFPAAAKYCFSAKPEVFLIGLWGCQKVDRWAVQNQRLFFLTVSTLGFNYSKNKIKSRSSRYIKKGVWQGSSGKKTDKEFYTLQVKMIKEKLTNAKAISQKFLGAWKNDIILLWVIRSITTSWPGDSIPGPYTQPAFP